MALTGEAGTGKLHLAKYLHELSGPERGLRVFDTETEPESALRSLATCVSEASSAGNTVILRRIDRLPAENLTQLYALVRHGPHTLPGNVAGRLVVTCRTIPKVPEMLERVLAVFSHHVWVPPLHRHAEDIADLVPALLAELGGQRGAYCSLPVVQALMRCPWPGNMAELRDVLASALATFSERKLELHHLPAWLLKQAHQRQFSPLERSERDLIIETLESVGNNRTKAARILGIGRTTLYRKMRSLGIATDQELAR